MSPLSEGGDEARDGFPGLGSRDFWWQLLKARGLRALWWQLLWGVWLHQVSRQCSRRAYLGMAKLASSKVASLTATIGASDRAKKGGVRVLRGNIFCAVAWQPVTPVLRHVL